MQSMLTPARIILNLGTVLSTLLTITRSVVALGGDMAEIQFESQIEKETKPPPPPKKNHQIVGNFITH